MGEIFEQELYNALKEIEKEKSKKVKSFLIELFEISLKHYKIKLEFPRIFSGIDGDIDLEWKNDDFQLLISIPEGDDELGGLYGNNYGDDEIKIDFDVKTPNLELYEWIKRQFK